MITHDVAIKAGPLRHGTGAPTAVNTIPVPASHTPALIVSKIGPEHCHSIGEAIGKAKPGSRILVYPGLYAEQVVIDRDLEIVGEGNGQDIIIAPPENVPCVVMRTAYAVVRNVSIRRRKTSDENQSSAVVAGQGRLVLQHLAVTCPASAAVLATGAAAACSMHNVSLGGSRWGVWATDGAEVVIERSIVSECEWQGIEIRDEAWCTVRSCEVHDCGGVGITVSPKGELRCEDSVVRDNRGSGIQIHSNAKNRISGCEIVRNSMAGLVLDKAALAQIRHTHLSGNGGNGSSQVEVSGKSRVVVQSCAISDGASHGMHVTTGSAATIEDCSFQAFGKECLCVFESSNVTCDRSRFLHSESFCVSAFQKCQALLRHCELGQSATRSAIIVQAESSANSSLQVQECVIADCQGAGVRLSQESSGKITDTVINGLYAFYVATNSQLIGAGNSHNGTPLPDTDETEEEDEDEEEDDEGDDEGASEDSDEDGEEEDYDQEYEEDDEEDEEEEEEEYDQDSGEVEFATAVELVCDECGEQWAVEESGVTMCPRDDCNARYVVDSDENVTRIEDGGAYDDDPDAEQDDTEEAWEDADEE